MAEITVESSSEKEAKEKALEQLNEKEENDLKASDLEVELIEEKKGFLGIGKKKVFKVKWSPEDSQQDDGEEVESKEVEESVKNITEEESKEVESEDGDIKLVVKEEGVFLQMNPPQAGGREVTLPEIEEVLGINEIEEADYDKISEILAENIHEPTKIAPRKPDLDRDAEIKVEISEDEMEAELSVKPPLGGENATLDKVKSVLEEAGVSYGIKEDILKELTNEAGVIEGEVKEVLIAEGIESVPGKDAVIDFKFDVESSEKKVRKLEDGTVDYRNLDRINNVEPEEVLATKKPSQPGTPGTKVTGDSIEPQPPADKPIPAGKNTELSSDELTLYSEIEGQVVYDGNKLEVVPVHTVRGDVDLSTGNVKFVGTVIVEGDIKDDMEVKAKHDINVKGTVQGAKLEAGGEVLIQSGFVGKNKGEISAEEDVQIKFIENGKVITDGNLIVTEAIMHSNIDTASIVKVENKGLIVGGRVRAGKEIDAKVVGSNLATKTELSVGITPELRDEYNEVTEELENYQEKLDEALKSIKYIKNREKKYDGQLSERERELLSQKTRTRFQAAKHIEELKEEQKSLQKRLKEGKDGRIKVQNTLHSGVVVKIGTETKKIAKELSNVQFYIEEGEIKQGSYS